MQKSPILTPDGRPVFMAGGPDAWKVTPHRGFVVSLEWLGNHRRAEPAMIIWAETNILTAGEDNGFWVIGRRALTEFVGFDKNGKCTGSGSEHCFREARAAMPAMGKDPNDQQAFLALVDCVIRFAPDLHHMPPAPKRVRRRLAGEAMWEVTASDKNTGRVIQEAAV